MLVTLDGIMVRRVDRSGPHTELILQTIGEIVRAAGHHVQVQPNESARSVEVRLEATIFDHNVVRYVHKQLPHHIYDDVYCFALSEPSDAEHVYWNRTPLADHNKMGLARRLEVMHGVDRLHAYQHMNKTALLLAVDPTYQAPPPNNAVAHVGAPVHPKAVGAPHAVVPVAAPAPPKAGPAKPPPAPAAKPAAKAKGKGKGVGKGKGKGKR